MEREWFAALLICLLLMPFCAHAQAGELAALEKDRDTAAVGEAVTVSATFVNLGSGAVEAKLNGEAYLEGELVSVIEGGTSQVPPGAAGVLEAVFVPGKIGLYTIKGTVIYSGESTSQKEVTIPVISKSTGMELAEDMTVPLMVDGLLALVIVAGVLMLKRRRR